MINHNKSNTFEELKVYSFLNTNEKVFLICSKCKKVPELKLVSPTAIQYQCDCSKNGITNLSTVVTLLSTQVNQKELLKKENKDDITVSNEVNIESKCQIHKEHLFCHCEKCKIDLCYLCLKNHKTHKRIGFKALRKQIKLDTIKQKFDEGVEKIRENFTEVKDEVISLLEKKIKQVQKAFNENIEQNSNIISYISSLIEMYENTKKIPNYQIVRNLLLNTQFNPLTIDNNTENELSLDNKVKYAKDFFNNNFLVYPNKMNLVFSLYTNNAISSLLSLNNKNIAYGTQEGSIYIYNFKEKRIIDTLNGHFGQVNYLSKLDENRFISSSSDKTIKIWNKNLNNNLVNLNLEIIKENPVLVKYECEATLLGHTNKVCKAILISNSRIASCSYDQTIKIWNSHPTYECLSTLQGHKREVTLIIELTDGRLLSNSIDANNTLLFWNLSSYKKEDTPSIIGLGISGERSNIVQIDNNRVILDNTNHKCLYMKNEIYVVNIKTYQIESTFLFDNEYIKTFCFLPNHKLILGSTKGLICEDESSNSKFSKEKQNKQIVTNFSLITNDLIASSGNEGEIKFWKINKNW